MASVALASPTSVFDRMKALVLDSVSSPLTRLAYGQALDCFLGWYAKTEPGPLSKSVVNSYRASLIARGLSSSSIGKHLSAVRKFAAEAADNGLLDLAIAESIQRVKGVKQQGTRSGNWLTERAAQTLLDAPDTRLLKGKRDEAMIAVMLGSGLRRSELVALTFDHIQRRDDRWAIVDLIGKHGRIRSVPIADWVKDAIDRWTGAAGICSGRVFRWVRKSGLVVGEDLSSQSVYDSLSIYATRHGMKLAPHDMRRTFAKLARAGGATIEQIQISLGHASIQTTERYLGTRQDFVDAPSDRIKLRSH